MTTCSLRAEAVALNRIETSTTVLLKYDLGFSGDGNRKINTYIFQVFFVFDTTPNV